MTRLPMKTRALLLLICLMAPVLGEVNDEESATDLEERLINVQSTLKDLKQDQTDIRKSIDARLDNFEKSVNAKLHKFEKSLEEIVVTLKRQNTSASFDTFREDVNERLDKFELKLAEKFGQCEREDHSAFVVPSTVQPNSTLETFEPKITELGGSTIPRDCADVYDQQSQRSTAYTIQPPGSKPFKVYCDMTTDGGGWTVFQKRGDFPDIPADYFNRTWQSYRDGFGDLKTEFWLGLTKIALVTAFENGDQELRVDLADLEGNKAYAKYQNFRVEDETKGFRLTIGSYSGNAGDSLGLHRSQKFSSSDHDNDNNSRNCALLFSGGWWYKKCFDSSLNGLNLRSKKTDIYKGIIWYHWKGWYYSLPQAEMKFRPMGWTSKRN